MLCPTWRIRDETHPMPPTHCHPASMKRHDMSPLLMLTAASQRINHEYRSDRALVGWSASCPAGLPSPDHQKQIFKQP